MNDNETTAIDVWDEVTVNTNKVLFKLEERFPDFKEQIDETSLENLLEEIRLVAGTVFVPASLIIKFGKSQNFIAMEAAKKELAIVPVGMYTDTRGSRVLFGFLVGAEPDKLHQTGQQYMHEFAIRDATCVH